jgi:hypothetical protein
VRKRCDRKGAKAQWRLGSAGVETLSK